MDEQDNPYPRRLEREDDQRFTPEAVIWLLSLDKAYFPSELAKAFPRIVNRLAATGTIPSKAASTWTACWWTIGAGARVFPCRCYGI